MIEPECIACANNARVDSLPPRERVVLDLYWRAAHAFGTGIPGWLVLVPRRHVTAIADLTDAEAAALGPWQVRLSRALQAVTGCTKTYIAQFAEAKGFGHVHFHIVPRMGDLPDDLRGPKIFAALGRDERHDVPATERDRLALLIARALG
jgi:diadenosine tetraphosphate (Ap4A) HIT family hydrolase